MQGVEIWAKRVQLLLETARKVTKLGFLSGIPTDPNFTPSIHAGYPRDTATWHRSGFCRCRRKV